jgi:hypothetical protein
LEEDMTVSSAQDHNQLFRRLERSTSLIVRHPDFPGKAEAIKRCRDDIEDRFHQGMLTSEQRGYLLSILDGDDMLD